MYACTHCLPFLRTRVLRLIMDPSEYQNPYTAWILGLNSRLTQRVSSSSNGFGRTIFTSVFGYIIIFYSILYILISITVVKCLHGTPAFWWISQSKKRSEAKKRSFDVRILYHTRLWYNIFIYDPIGTLSLKLTKTQYSVRDLLLFHDLLWCCCIW